MPMFKRDVLTLADILQKCLRQDGLETPLQQKTCHRLVGQSCG